MPRPFAAVARLPARGDNVAIAAFRLEAGIEIEYENTIFALSHSVLEGHRFAIEPIASDGALLSWGLPFGIATRAIQPGEYVANPDMLEALEGRTLDFAIPDTPNFRNSIKPHAIDEARFSPGRQVELYGEEREFMGYRRRPSRGVGTRNFIVVLGTTSQSGSYARLLGERLAGVADGFENINGVAAIAHTEGAGDDPLNNRDFLLRTLAGLVVHPNVGAILITDAGSGQIDNETLREFLHARGYPIDDVVHHFFRLTGHLAADLDAGATLVESWLDTVNSTERTPEPLSGLTIALQCGGSDAFSGVSGNPLAGSVAQEIIRHGGCANIAETDELIGAESYMLKNVRSLEVARKFLGFIEEFKERVSWHGATAEGNPSGGNRFRGLYNIVLKSIGAAMKRAPAVRLDAAVDYAERMTNPGFYFMNTPGNDLESIAGQVAGGSNMIFFVTGNGSITNFPFVPTIKLVTTTPRFERLAREMDVNAGAYQDGRPLEDLTRDMLDLTVEVASGRRSRGEDAGHSQISIWRNWRQTDDSRTAELMAEQPPSGEPRAIQTDGLLGGDWVFQAIRTSRGHVTDQVGLVLPTSLCSGQIARMSAMQLNERGIGQGDARAPISRYVALVHTEGCGVSLASVRDIYNDAMVSYMTHPIVGYGVFLEHGCEKTHNDYMRRQLLDRGGDPEACGWASVQADGGIETVLEKIQTWFDERLAAAAPPVYELVGLETLRLGLTSTGSVPDDVETALAQLTRTIVAAGGTVVVPQSASLGAAFSEGTTSISDPTLSYGESVSTAGFHVMEAPSRHWTETLTGLGATGVEIILGYQAEHPMPSHPLVPVLQVTREKEGKAAEDFDVVLGDADDIADTIMSRVIATAGREYRPKLAAQNHVDFQFTRGLLGVST